MTLDDNVDFLNEAKKFYEDIANNPSLNETIKTYFTIESLESAIDIMRKYQKIEEILDQLIDSKIRTYDAVIEIEDIVYGQTEVGNGNDD